MFLQSHDGLRQLVLCHAQHHRHVARGRALQLLRPEPGCGLLRGVSVPGLPAGGHLGPQEGPPGHGEGVCV